MLSACVVLTSCQKEDVTDNAGEIPTSELGDTQTVNVLINGKVKSLEVSSLDGETLVSQSKDYEEVSRVMNSENLMVFINPEIDRPIFFSDNQAFKDFEANNLDKTTIFAEFATSPNSDVKEASAARSSSTGSFSIYEHSYFGGRSYSESLSSSFPRKIVRNLNQGACLTGGTNFNDKISGIQVNNLNVVFTEHAGFGGKSIYIQAGGTSFQMNRLKSVSFKSYLIPNDLTGCGLSCWLGNDWDDKISAITASAIGTSIWYPTSGYVCSGGSQGGGGGPISGGDKNHK